MGTKMPHLRPSPLKTLKNTIHYLILFYFLSFNMEYFVLKPHYWNRYEVVDDSRSLTSRYWTVIQGTIRLKQFSKKPLLPLRVPPHVLAELIIVPYMKSCYAWSPVVLLWVSLQVLVPSFCIFLRLLNAWQLECAVEKLRQPPAPHLRRVQVWNTLWESNHR